jgi:hypothetical protein
VSLVVALLTGCSGQPTDAPAIDEQLPNSPASVSVSPSSLPLVEHQGDPPPLAPGTYQIGYHLAAHEVVPDAFVTVPAGYIEEASWYVVSNDHHEFLGLWTVDEADKDACRHFRQDTYDPGPSVHDLARALVATRSVHASEPQPVTLARYEGLYVEVAGPPHVKSCPDFEGLKAGLWTSGHGGRGIYGDRQVDLVWILDADGQRIVVNAAYSAESTAADIRKLTAMVNSLEFTQAAQD